LILLKATSSTAPNLEKSTAGMGGIPVPPVFVAAAAGWLLAVTIAFTCF
jgi:hypothetical protein